MITLGNTYQDRITGFKGVATGHVKYITGCNQALLAPKVDDSGKLVEASWFDEQRLAPIDAAPISLDNTSTPGPDRAAPIR